MPAKYVRFQGSCLDPAGVEDAAESHSAYRATALLASFPFLYVSPEITRKLTWKPLVMKLFIAKTKYVQTTTELHLYLTEYNMSSVLYLE